MTARPRRGALVWVLPTVLLLACSTGTGPAASPSGASRDVPAPISTRALVIADRTEPENLADRIPARVPGGGNTDTPRLFNAGLVLDDDKGEPRAYLAEAVPQLNTDSWRVFPDGRMETTYRLKPNLTWHDGRALSADDFVFAWRVYLLPDLGAADIPPFAQMDEVAAPDDRTVRITWRGPYPDAGQLRSADFQALPRHILEDDVQRDPSVTLARNLFWTTGYVGLGPFRLDRWEQGAFLDASAFDGHVWGKPKISRITVKFMPDANAVMASLLSGDVDFTVRVTIEVKQGVLLEPDWVARGAGVVMMIPSYWRRAEVQHRPEYASPAAMGDVRVRRALLHAIDRDAQNFGVYEGRALFADSMIPPSAPSFAEAERIVPKYPHDVRRAEALMNEAGWVRGTDGVYARGTDEKFSVELRINSAPESQVEVSITGDALRRAGFDPREVLVPRAQQRIGEVRSQFPSLYSAGGGLGEKESFPNFVSTTIPSAENRWVGMNRGGWNSPEYDRLFAAFNTTLERSERSRLAAQMAANFMDQVAALSMLFYPSVVAHTSALTGPAPFVSTTLTAWNVHEWQLR